MRGSTVVSYLQLVGGGYLKYLKVGLIAWLGLALGLAFAGSGDPCEPCPVRGGGLLSPAQ